MSQQEARATAAIVPVSKKRRKFAYLLLAFTLAPFVAFLAYLAAAVSGSVAEYEILAEGWRVSSRWLACGLAFVVTSIWFLLIVAQTPYRTGIKSYFKMTGCAAFGFLMLLAFWGVTLTSALPRLAAIWAEPGIRTATVEGFARYSFKGPHLVMRTSATDVDFYEKAIEGKRLPEIGDVVTLSGRETAFGFLFDYELD
ncbi:hypothetical protein [Paracoccus sp. IB05]|uniref:hypothetical protein n=1 Tax=Paracoccus sp. IB05 TaxID=2779367 RepID=UPI0018E868AE|nr:hypothetical protein [Paracoccus sp. IB05]MBJ2151993.1 hypothetical protein [Paracoccus sp. IB05]